MAIKKKQSTSEADWREAMDNIEYLVSREEMKALVRKTVSEIRTTTHWKKAAYSWSAGKDSVVLSMLCRMAGIIDCVFVYCDLEYKAFMDWVAKNKPPQCECINTGQNLLWLSKHQEMLFPQDFKTAGKWFKIVQHRGQEIYYKNHSLDMLLLGRRKADGNFVGRGSNIYTNNKGITRFSPLADWTHEDVLACIHYFDLQIPPIYGWKNGYLCGTHNWAARQWTGNESNGWAEVYEIEPGIVYEASKYFSGAKEFLDGKAKEKFNA